MPGRVNKGRAWLIYGFLRHGLIKTFPVGGQMDTGFRQGDPERRIRGCASWRFGQDVKETPEQRSPPCGSNRTMRAVGFQQMASPSSRNKRIADGSAASLTESPTEKDLEVGVSA